MADGLVEYLVRVDNQASAPLLESAKAAVEAASAAAKLADEQRQAAEQARQLANASARLESIIARGSPVQEAALRFRRLNQELAALAKTGVDQTLVARAQAKAQAEFIAAITQSEPPLRKLRTETADATGVATRGMGAAAAATGNLRAQLIDIGVMLQGGANPLTILSTQGPQVAEALAQMSASGASVTSAFGALGPAIAGVAVAAGGLFLAYKAMTEDSNRAAAAAANLTAAKLRLLPVLRATADEQLRLRLSAGEITKEYFNMEMAARTSQRGLADANREPAAEIARLYKAQAGVNAAIGDFGDWLQSTGIPGGKLWGAAIDGVTTSTEELTQDIGTQTAIIEANAAAYRSSRDAAQEAVSVNADLAESANKATAAAAAATAAEQRRAAAAIELARRQAAAIAEVNRRRAEEANIVRQATSGLDQLALTVLQYTETEEQRVNRVFAGYQEQLALQRGFLEASGADLTKYAELEVAIEEAKQAELKRLREQGQQDAQAAVTPGTEPISAASAIGAVAGGPSGLLSLLGQVGGPIGAGVAAGLALLQQVGQTTPEGESQFVATFRGFIDTLLDAIPMLGSAITELLTSIIVDAGPALAQMAPAVINSVVDALPEMIPAIIGAIPRIIEAFLVGLHVQLPLALFKALMMVFSIEFWKNMVVSFWEGLKLAARDLGQALAAALKDILTPFKNEEGTGLFQRGGKVATAARDIGQGIGNVAEDAADWFVGMFATGGYVPRTGLALVHAGERIVPAGTSGSAPRSMGRNVTVNVNMPQGAYIGSAADIVRELNRSLGSANLGLRWSDG